jgi:hypothetical protein
VLILRENRQVGAQAGHHLEQSPLAATAGGDVDAISSGSGVHGTNLSQVKEDDAKMRPV